MTVNISSRGDVGCFSKNSAHVVPIRAVLFERQSAKYSVPSASHNAVSDQLADSKSTRSLAVSPAVNSTDFRHGLPKFSFGLRSYQRMAPHAIQHAKLSLHHLRQWRRLCGERRLKASDIRIHVFVRNADHDETVSRKQVVPYSVVEFSYRQKVTLAPNWTCLGAVLVFIAVITPKFAALIFAAGAPNVGVLVKFVASARN